MGKRILVTGGMGFIGRALAKSLLVDGNDVTVFDNMFRAHKSEKSWGGERYPGDIRDRTDVFDAVRGQDQVIHLAAINGTQFFYENPKLVLDVATRGILNVVEACEYLHVDDLVVFSSSEVYQTPPFIPTHEHVPMVIPDPLNPRYSYAGGKIISELIALNSVIPNVRVIRPHNVYGPNMGREHVVPQLTEKMIHRVSAGTEVVSLPIQGSGFETRAFCYIDDAVEGIKLVIEKGRHREIYNVGTDEETSIATVADMIGACFGVDIVFDAEETPAGSVTRRCPDISKLRGLGYEPKTDLFRGISKTVEWYRKNQ